MYVKRADEEIIMAYLFINNLSYTGNNVTLTEKFKELTKNKLELDMSSSGRLHYFLRVEVSKRKKVLLANFKNKIK